MLQRQKGLREFAWLLAIGIGVALTSLVGRTASIVAQTRGLRVWVNPKLRDLVDDDLPTIESLPVRPFFNHAVFVLATSLACPVLVLNCLMLVDFKSGLFTLAVLTTGPLLVFAAYVWTATRIIANNPGEYWK